MKTDNFATIAGLDLDPIKVKLMHPQSGEGWSLQKANAVEVEYRRFLYLMKKFPEERTAPLFDVDTFWHYHILDTLKYAADCEAVFGYFLHHFPYIGLRGEEDEQAHVALGDRMKELYESTFEEPYVRGQGPETAWSGATVVAAWSGAAQPQATGAGEPQVAWSGAARPQVAWSGAAQPKTAGAGQPQVAWSGAAQPKSAGAGQPQVAWSGAAQPNTAVAGQPQVAWSGADKPAPANGTAWSGAAAKDDFYAVRPTLSQAA